jgi:hypothetical protein
VNSASPTAARHASCRKFSPDASTERAIAALTSAWPGTIRRRQFHDKLSNEFLAIAVGEPCDLALTLRKLAFIRVHLRLRQDVFWQLLWPSPLIWVVNTVRGAALVERAKQIALHFTFFRAQVAVAPTSTYNCRVIPKWMTAD